MSPARGLSGAFSPGSSGRYSIVEAHMGTLRISLQVDANVLVRAVEALWNESVDVRLQVGQHRRCRAAVEAGNEQGPGDQGAERWRPG